MAGTWIGYGERPDNLDKVYLVPLEQIPIATKMNKTAIRCDLAKKI